MILVQLRYGSDSDSSGGALIVDGEFLCHTVEDEARQVKVYGETRVPCGCYELKLRTEGGMHERYKEIFPWHKGMLWLQNVPEFDWIYLHPGEIESQTDGCILTGYTALSRNGFALDRAVLAYRDLCIKVYAAFDRRERVYINIIDFDKMFEYGLSCIAQ